MPTIFDPGKHRDLKPQDFVVVPRGESEDVAFVAALEHKSSKQVKLRRKPYPQVLRRATEQEVDAWWKRKAIERKAIVICKEKARELKLDMKISKVRIEMNDNRAMFYFTADQRVDFRALVRELSALLRMRIDLWQIGVRDEARFLDGFGVCGLQTCCSTWLEEFRPITIRMAKQQDISLPPSKLSGQCGRLLCCLSYEVDQYKEMSKNALPKGATIKYDGEKEGIIIDRNLIKRTYLVTDSSGAFHTIPMDQTEVDSARVPEQMTRFGKEMVQKAQRQSISEMMNSAASDENVPQQQQLQPGLEAHEPTKEATAKPEDVTEPIKAPPPPSKKQPRAQADNPVQDKSPRQQPKDRRGRGKKKKQAKPVVDQKSVPDEQPKSENPGRRKKKRRR